ncbi:MAG: hypothetical protein R3200_05795 [Xanthomonadales bacterium]|nr:hypothetical protein [Xanthomonadales bacterium]
MGRLLVTCLALLLCSATWADFDSGMSAYRLGDYQRAFKEFREAAIAGDPTAQFNVGVMYYRGEHVERDLVKAYGWIELATNRPGTEALIQAQEILAVMLTPEEVDAGMQLAMDLAERHGLDYRPDYQTHPETRVANSLR